MGSPAQCPCPRIYEVQIGDCWCLGGGQRAMSRWRFSPFRCIVSFPSPLAVPLAVAWRLKRVSRQENGRVSTQPIGLSQCYSSTPWLHRFLSHSSHHRDPHFCIGLLPATSPRVS